MEHSPREIQAAKDSPDVPSNPVIGRTDFNLTNSPFSTGNQEQYSARNSVTQYSGFNPDIVGTPSTFLNADRFIFVNALEPSAPGQRRRTDQKAINAHVQTTAYRQRRSAAVERLKRNIKANVGRSRPRVPFQLEPNRPYSQNSVLAAAAPLVKGVASPRGRPNTRNQQASIDSRGFNPSNTLISAIDGKRNFEDEDEDEDDACLEVRAMQVVLKSLSQRMTSLEKSRMLHGSPRSLLDSADIDPFAISSVPIIKGMNKIFSHFLEVMIPGVFPIRSQAVAQNEWAMELAYAQPMVFFSILAIAAAELEARTGQLGNGSVETSYTERDLLSRKVPDFVEYKLKASKIASQKMSSLEEAVDVSTIYALMCLLGIEVITGNAKEISVHVSGLQRLIAVRGGYQGLPPYVTETVLSTTYMCAAMTGSLPPAPPSSSLQVSLSTFDTILSDSLPSLRDLGTALLLPAVTALFDWQLNQAFRDLREVILYREHFHHRECPPPPNELDHFNIKSYNLRYLVLTLPFQMQTPVSDKQEACRIALLIFWNANYLVGQPDSALFRHLTIKLKAALENSDLQGLWDSHCDLLMWVMFLGSHISAGQRERPWFVMNLARGASFLKLGEWADIRAMLLHFFYIDRIYQKSFQEAWQEARMLMDMLGT